MGAKWFCTWCGEEHSPDLVTQLDARYATGSCAGVKRPLVRDSAEATRLAAAGGKLRPKGVPIGGGQRRTEPTPVDAKRSAEIRGAQP